MTKKILFIVALVLVQSFQFIAAQDVKQPVQFVFSANKLSDTSATLLVKATALNGTRILTAVKKSNDDVFVSALQLDSSLKADAKIKEEGVAGAVALPGSTDKGTAYDSVTYVYTVYFKAGTSAIKGTFNWLGVKGEEFPSGEEKISVTIEAGTVAAPVTDAAPTTDTGSMWSIFLLCLATGLLAVITPCVFPLIPVTVSFFFKAKQNKNGRFKKCSLVFVIDCADLYHTNTYTYTYFWR